MAADGHLSRHPDALRIVLAEVARPERTPLSERIARALLPVVLRQRLEGLVGSRGGPSEFRSVSPTVPFPPHP
jgi:hypothetical protein